MKTTAILKLINLLLVVLYSGFSVCAQDVLPSVTVTSTSNVSTKVSNIFQKDFKDAKNVKWTKLKRDYLVDFITADIKNTAVYGKRGYRVYHISYGFERHLPVDIKNDLKANYVNYKIGSTFHVKQDLRDVWIANLEGDKRYVIVRMENGEMIEVLNNEAEGLVANSKQ